MAMGARVDEEAMEGMTAPRDSWGHRARETTQNNIVHRARARTQNNISKQQIAIGYIAITFRTTGHSWVGTCRVGTMPATQKKHWIWVKDG